MGRLLYRDDSLASPRLIQFANLKSEALFHYLRHGYAEDAFPDRRAQLARYVELLLEGRAARFAFDQSFDITTAELDAEYVDYLSNSRRPRVDVEHGELAPVQVPGAAPLDPDRVAILLGELGLNSGRLDTAEQLFGSLVETEAPVARAYSGLGDALRFDLDEVSDQMIAAYFEQAIALAPEDLNIILDLGEYWESELSDCEKTYSEARRQSLFAVMQEQFTRAFKMAPDNPEVNLAMAQFYLFPEQDWRLGVSYQEKAFAALPADSFIMEQAAKYAMAANEFDYAEQLISEMAQPLHFYGEPDYVSDLRIRLLKKRRNEPYDACAVY
jgi:Flp pilus assembly protein TadD